MNPRDMPSLESSFLYPSERVDPMHEIARVPEGVLIYSDRIIRDDRAETYRVLRMPMVLR